MLTRRGFWLLFGTLVAFLPAVLTAQLEAAVVPLSVLLWFGFQATMHSLRATYAARRLRVVRRIGGRENVRVVRWAQRVLAVEVEISNPTAIGFSQLEVSDFLPSGGTVVTGNPNRLVDLPPRGSARIAFDLRLANPGEFRFEGVHLGIVEPHGLFVAAHFLETPTTALILPAPVMLPGVLQTRTFEERKLGQGVHRLRAVGSSCELLEVRPYVPGDSPRSIAWKVSARRDDLMTRDYESEVPTRVQLLLDAGHSMRFGRGAEPPIVAAINALASVAHRAISARDPVGLTIDDGVTTSRLKPAFGARQFARIQTALAKTATQPAPATLIQAAELQDAVLATAWRYRPQWLRPSVNRPIAWWRSIRVFSVRGVLASFVLPVVAGSLLAGRFLWVFGLTVTAGLFLIFGPKPRTSKGMRVQRKTAAHLLAMDAGQDAAETAKLIANDRAFAAAAQAFLDRWNWPFPRGLVDLDGLPIGDGMPRVSRLAACVRSIVAHAKEREAIIVFANLVETAEDCGPLIQALRLATIRGHRTLVLFVWQFAADAKKLATTAPTGSAASIADEFDRARAEVGRQRLVDECRRIGVPCLAYSGDESTAVVLHRIDRIRQALGKTHRRQKQRG